MARNRWFQARAVDHLAASIAAGGFREPPTVLAYSYAARDILRLAREAGLPTILAQIDGGEAEESLVADLGMRQSACSPERAPAYYWQDWRDECRLADAIIVNSPWSRQLLLSAGIDATKLVVAPVVYKRDHAGSAAPHQYPPAFNSERPLEILFLGTLTLRKGVTEVIEAACALAGRPVRFTFVGGDPEARFASVDDFSSITRYARVPRSQVINFFQKADVFLFPTHSDGFGMTQLEALAAGLPVIASRNCAPLVEHGRTGLVLEEVSSLAIVRAIETCLAEPARLSAMSAAAISSAERFERQSAESLHDVIRDILSIQAA